MNFHILKTTGCTWCRGSQLIGCILLFMLQYGNYEADAHILVYRERTNQLIEEYNDMPAQFGPSLPDNGLKVYAYMAQPLTIGCDKIEPAPKNEHPFPKARFAVIIQRGNCTFEKKVRNAQAAKFDIVIVYNDDGDELQQMSADNTTAIHIPSVFVGATAGNNLHELILYKDIFLVINGELPFNINTQLILPFSILIGLCFLIMIFYMVYKCIREERRLRRYRLPKSMLKKLPILKYTKNNTELSCDTCVICLDEFVEGDKLRVLPCKHPYHSHCIDPWLTETRRVCPICKRKVFTKGEARANRNRLYSLDSVTDTDDDTTPLLQTANTAVAAAGTTGANSNAARASNTNRSTRSSRTTPTTNHGTFWRNTTNEAAVEAGSDDENVLLSHQSPAHRGNSRRINPFDRAPNLPPHLVEQLSSQRRSIWSYPILRLFRRSQSISVAAPPFLEEVLPEVTHSIINSQIAPGIMVAAAVAPAISAAVAAVSNNILNPNLSGSFQDDDDLPPHQSIYEPIAVVTPTANAEDTLSEGVFVETPSTQGCIGVVALPNTTETLIRENSASTSSRQFPI